jgi:hypothetical protein
VLLRVAAEGWPVRRFRGEGDGPRGGRSRHLDPDNGRAGQTVPSAERPAVQSGQVLGNPGDLARPSYATIERAFLEETLLVIRLISLQG